MKKYLPICLILIFSIICLSISKNENKDLKENAKKDSKDIIIASYVNGVYTDELPTESKYFGYVKCFDNSGNEIDSLGFVTWENNKWNVKVTDISSSGTCNVYFIDPPAHWLDAESGTLLKAIKDNNKVENVRSIPGKQINKEDEAVLSGTLDDYGTSYFFRGNVKNNYVQFAGKCWQIVRVTGDGSIKLILSNESGTDCTVKNPYAKWDGTKTTVSFNGNEETYVDGNGETKYVYSKASGVGFMYGDANANNYFDAQANLHDSTILKALKQWYDREFTSENVINKLADVIWCGDKSLSSGDGITSSEFGFFGRRTTPQLICPTSDRINGNIGNLSRYTANDIVNGNGLLKTDQGDGTYKYYPIGLLTYDELNFAGEGLRSANTNCYLQTGAYYWTMSPFYNNNTSARVGRVNKPGFQIDYSSVSDSGPNLRPMVALNYNVQATYNASSEYEPGTVNNPYVISV